MIRKANIVYIIFTIILLYIISPWFFEKKFLFNEIISAIGFLLIIYKRFKIGNDKISIAILLLLCWCGVHLFTSLFRMDNIYYYLRNSVIVYSIFGYFIGYYLFPYLNGYFGKFKRILQYYIGILLFVPISYFFFERFGMATLFPALYKDSKNKWILPLLVLMNIIYSITYDSATAIILTFFYLLIWFSPGYRFFKQVVLTAFLGFSLFFIYIQPNLNLIAKKFSPYNDNGIIEVRASNPILAMDPNSTWRLVFWKQIIIDHFPTNLFGLGFGTPVMKYFPVEDSKKIPTLPYVLGAHNSYVYLFGRLGIIYLLFLLVIYPIIFKEYFYFKDYYYKNKAILIFWSFFAITIIALFNPTLESPIYAVAYWLILGFLAKAIHNREKAPI